MLNFELAQMMQMMLVLQAQQQHSRLSCRHSSNKHSSRKRFKRGAEMEARKQEEEKNRCILNLRLCILNVHLPRDSAWKF